MIDLETYLTQHGIDYKDKGDYYKIRCINPAHNDSSPSMSILKDYPHGFHCFGCGMRGSIHKFVKTVSGETLTDKTSSVDKTFYSTTRRKQKEKKIYSYEKEMFQSVYQNRDVMKYLKVKRRVTDDFIRDFKIQFTQKANINESTFYNRVVVPIYENGKLVNIEGRDYTEKSKVKVLYPKNAKSDTIFNLDNIDLSKPVYLVEGIFDLPRVYDYSKNCIALLGASLGKNQIQQLNQIHNLILIPDNDDAGHELILNMDKELDIDFHIAFLPECVKDAGEAEEHDIVHAIHNKIHIIDYIKSVVGYEDKDEVNDRSLW